MRLIFHGTVANGKIEFERPADLKVAVAKLEGKAVSLTLEKRKSIRSRNQNDWYWSVLELFAKEIGYETKEKLHEDLAWKFLRKHHECGLETRRSTAELNTVEFGEYMDKVIQLAAEYGFVVPDPERVEVGAGW